MNRTLCFLAAACTALAACGSASREPAAGDTLSPVPLTDRAAVAAAAETTDLAAVAAACDDGNPEQPGVIEVRGELRDANTAVELEDCVIHLDAGADVTLNNVTVTGGIVNLHDRDTDPSANTVRLQRVVFDNQAVLIELNDADDKIRAEALDATVVDGFSVRAAGPVEEDHAGGEVRMVASAIVATSADAPVIVAASEHSGTVEMVDTTIDADGLVTVIAGTCQARRGPSLLDCSTGAYFEDLDSE